MAGRRSLVVGSRGSKLAMWQTRFIVETLTKFFPDLECRIETFKTIGDDIVDRPLPELGGKGVFTARLEEALLGGDVDIAVHSLKDLPIEDTPGLTVGAITSRADARDVLVTRDGRPLDELPPGASVGTSSLRRQAQLLQARPDLCMKPIRGNVETRLRKVTDGDYDATVLAAAGLGRLELGASCTSPLSFDTMLPAPGQGALAVQCRADDTDTLELLAKIDDAGDRACAQAERAFLAGLGGGCAAPVGAYAMAMPDGAIRLRGLVARPDGTNSVVVERAGADGIALGKSLAEEAVAAGARDILYDAREALSGKLPLKGKRIVVTRAAHQASELCNALSGLGAEPIRMPLIETIPIVDRATIDAIREAASPGDWVVFTSANGVTATWNAVGAADDGVFADLSVAAVGDKTGAALSRHGVKPDFVPDTFTGEALAESLPDVSGRQVWLLRAETAGVAIVSGLTARGAKVHDVPVYRTVPVPVDPCVAEELRKGVDAVTFTSGSTVRHFAAACDRAQLKKNVFSSTLIICIGPSTAEVARGFGFDVGVVPDTHNVSGLVDAIAEHFTEVTS